MSPTQLTNEALDAITATFLIDQLQEVLLRMKLPMTADGRQLDYGDLYGRQLRGLRHTVVDHQELVARRDGTDWERERRVAHVILERAKWAGSTLSVIQRIYAGVLDEEFWGGHKQLPLAPMSLAERDRIVEELSKVPQITDAAAKALLGEMDDEQPETRVSKLNADAMRRLGSALQYPMQARERVPHGDPVLGALVNGLAKMNAEADLDERTILHLHLASEHASSCNWELTLDELVDHHEHEHDGPGTIRNHDRYVMFYSLTKAQETLSESDDHGGVQWGPPGLLEEGWAWTPPSMRIDWYQRLAEVYKAAKTRPVPQEPPMRADWHKLYAGHLTQAHGAGPHYSRLADLRAIHERMHHQLGPDPTHDINNLSPTGHD